MKTQLIGNHLYLFKKIIVIILAAGFLCCSLFVWGCGNTPQESSYYDEYLKEKIETIKTIGSENDISESFYFITDLHWEVNTKNSPMLMDKISAQTDIDTVVMGGDYIAMDHYIASDSLDIMENCVNSFNCKNVYTILGNHEQNIAHGHETPFISDEEANKAIGRGRGESTYYCVEKAETHIAGLYLNGNSLEVNDDQYEWIKQKLLGYDSSWTVLIYTHLYCQFLPDEDHEDAYVHRHEKGVVLDKALGDVADDIKCNIAGIFTGHIHLDWFEYNELGYPVSVTMCDSIGVYSLNSTDGTPPVVREENTVTEQAFDVVQIDTSDREVFITRIGAGSDRYYSY